jgi:hypothetical protein
MRFENFLKFAEKKEIRDRLKEFDPPALSNYIDPATVESIVNKRRSTKRPPSSKKPANSNAEHLERIAKMRELYGMFVQMEDNQGSALPKISPQYMPKEKESPGFKNMKTKLGDLQQA